MPILIVISFSFILSFCELFLNCAHHNNLFCSDHTYMSLFGIAIWIIFMILNVQSYKFAIPTLVRVNQKHTLRRCCCLPEAVDLSTNSKQTEVETENLPHPLSDNLLYSDTTSLQTNTTVITTTNENQIDSNTDISLYYKYFHWDIIRTYFNSFLLKLIKDEDIVDITTKTLSGLLWFSLVLGILGTIGFDTKPILSIFGIAGITLGLSLKDVFADLYAGIFVLFTRPFRRGSYINIGEYSGRVISMDMRYVRLYNSKEKVDIVLPVSLVYKNAIKITVPDSKSRKS